MTTTRVAWRLQGFYRAPRHSALHRTADGVTTLCGLTVPQDRVDRPRWALRDCSRCNRQATHPTSDRRTT